MPSAQMPERPLKAQLTIELVPATCWFSNVRSHVSAADWEKCKRFVRARSGDRCEICGGRGDWWPVECHEIWRYDLPTETQILDGLIALCPLCHQVKHLGHTQMRSKMAFTRAVSHFASVNDYSSREAEDRIIAAFDLWRARSAYDWALDISWLDKTLGIKLKIDNNSRNKDTDQWEPA